jgi:glucose dehydrogenase
MHSASEIVKPVLALLLIAYGGEATAQQDFTGWPDHGGDWGGSRYSSLTQINKDTVGGLELAWTYRTGVRLIGSSHWIRPMAESAGPLILK